MSADISTLSKIKNSQIQSKPKKKNSSDESSGGCLMGPSWKIYIFIIVFSILFVIFIIYLSKYLFPCPVIIEQLSGEIQPTSSIIQPGKSILAQFSCNSVQAII